MNEEQFFERHVENNQFPSNDALKQIILKKIMKDFEFEKIYTETEVNEIIKKYFDDFTLIRRELINFGYAQKSRFLACQKFQKNF